MDNRRATTINDIRDPEALEGACRQWLERDAIALDTEFVRESTYAPIPGLIQVADETGCWLLDPRALDDLKPFFRVLAADRPVKIMHSAGQDLELFRIMGADAPKALFDTQIAATLAGLGDLPGYAALVKDELGVVLDKGETRSDWTRRPLSEAQRHYAAQDVIHLPALHRRLDARLRELGRQSWQSDECRRLVAEAWKPDPANGLRRKRNAWRLEPREQELLVRLWRWREAQARQLDRPRQRVLDDARLNEFVRNPPCNHDELVQADLKAGWIRRFGNSFVKAIDEVLKRPADEFRVRFPAPPRNPGEKARLAALQRAVRDLSEQTGIPPGFLATRPTLDALATGHLDPAATPASLRGWRESAVLPALAEALQQVAERHPEG